MPFIFVLMFSFSLFAANARDGLLYIRQDYCVCKDGQAVAYGNCSSFCATQETHGAEILFASFNVVENKKYKTVYEWCTKRGTWDWKNPKCEMSFKDEEGKVQNLEVNVYDNIVSADVSSIAYDKVLVFGLDEVTTKASSDRAQLVKFNPAANYPLPLQTSALTQFTCFSNPLQKKYHFYFAPYLVPNPQSEGSPFVCHDAVSHGPKDDALFPRLEEVKGAINMWPNTSPLFYDNDANGYMDIHDAIRLHTKRFGGSIPMGTEFFTYFGLPGAEANYTQSGAQKASHAYVMKPFIDQATFYAFCPREEHYNSSTPVFRALGEVLGLATEGLYAGVEISDNQDFILLNETDIKAVWFYVKDGHFKVPNDSTVSRQTIYFYYPLDKVNPYVKKPSQKIYQVKTAEEIGMSTGNTYPSHDRRIACIPKN
jgi:hypothetical protein